MDEKFLVDTNIIIYYLDNKIPEKEIEKIENIFRNSFNISTITKIELLGWHKIDENDKIKLESFLNNANVFYLDYEIEQKSIEIKQKNNIATPDSIIGATSLINNFTIVTRNVKDFEKIEGLKIYKPFENK